MAGLLVPFGRLDVLLARGVGELSMSNGVEDCCRAWVLNDEIGGALGECPRDGSTDRLEWRECDAGRFGASSDVVRSFIEPAEINGRSNCAGQPAFAPIALRVCGGEASIRMVHGRNNDTMLDATATAAETSAI
jgi:hypothetical protein